MQGGTPDTLARGLALAIGCAGVWGPAVRWPITRKALATLVLGMVTLAWAPPLLAAAAVATVLLLLVVRLRRRSDRLDAFLARAAGDDTTSGAPEDAPPSTFPPSDCFLRLWCLSGLLVLSAALTFLELRQPYYFCQDDMLTGEAPALLQGLRSVWQGVFPEWDGHVFMGVPYASAGGGRLFYPPTYLAYAVSRHLLGNELAQVDVAAILHIVAAYFVVFWVLRRLGTGAAVSMAGALAVALSGPTLIMGRCWAMFIYGAVWSPLLFYAVARLTRGPVGWRWALLTGAGIGVLFQVGFVQLWVTVLLLMGLALLGYWLAGRLPSRQVPWFAAAVLLGVALAMPLMYQQWLLTRDLHMGPRSDNGVAPGMLAMLLPYPLATAPHPAGWGGLESRYMGQMYYFGTPFALLPVLGVVSLLTAGPCRRPRSPREGSEGPRSSDREEEADSLRHIDSSPHLWGANVWAALALFVLVLALGSDAGLWRLMSALPVLNIVNHYPFRLLPFLVLFAVLSGSVVAERLLRATPRRARWEMALAATTAGLLLWHVGFARSSFYQYGFPPTQPLSAPIGEILRAGGATGPHPQSRVMCWAPERSSLPEFRDTMKLNLPMLDGIPSFTGYDPLTSSKPTWLRAARAMELGPLAASRAFGVRWHVVSRLIAHPTFSGDSPVERVLETEVPLGDALPKLARARLPTAAALPDVTIYDAGPTDPLAFPEGDARHPLPLTLSNRGIDVDVSALPAGCRVIVNWLWYPPMRAQLGGAALPCAADAWGRIVVSVPPTAPGGPAGRALLHVRYAPNWGTGVAIGAALAAIALAAIVRLERGEINGSPRRAGTAAAAQSLAGIAP